MSRVVRGQFYLSNRTRFIIADLGLELSQVAREADLDFATLQKESAFLSHADYFRLWETLAAHFPHHTYPLEAVTRYSKDSFDSSMFAAFCSPNLSVAVERLAKFKPLIGPMQLVVHATDDCLNLQFDFGDLINVAPNVMVLTEVVFALALSRMATNKAIQPLCVSLPSPPSDPAFSSYFGVPIHAGRMPGIRFSAQDAQRPFVNFNDALWSFFEPKLRWQATTMEGAPMIDRVRNALLELLPSGRGSIEDVARQLAMSRRTLQRRLQGEGTSFQIVLNGLREELANHYLQNSTMTGAEISYLLGFSDPNSFFRAFHAWSGHTPSQARNAARAQMTSQN